MLDMKVGIIGCGAIAPLHIQAYQKLTNVEVVSLCDLNLERAKMLANNYGIKQTYADYGVMFEKEGLDLVDICTPPSTHVKIACDAAEKVPAILLEKPMAINVDECDQILNAIKKYDRKICIGHSQIFHPNIQEAKKIVEKDDFNLNSFRTTLKGSYEILRKYGLVAPWNIIPEQKGIIWEVCSHHAYLQAYFLSDIKEVYAVGSNYKYDVYDDFTVLLRTKNDEYGIIEISWLCPEGEVIYEFKDVSGRRLQIDWQFDYMLQLTQDPPMTYGSVFKNFIVDEKRLLHKWASFAYQYVKNRKRSPIINLLNRYVESIENDSPSPVTGEDGKITVHLLENIEKSLMEKRSIRM